MIQYTSLKMTLVIWNVLSSSFCVEALHKMHVKFCFQCSSSTIQPYISRRYLTSIGTTSVICCVACMMNVLLQLSTILMKMIKHQCKERWVYRETQNPADLELNLCLSDINIMSVNLVFTVSSLNEVFNQILEYM